MDLKALIQGVAQIAEDKKIEAAKVFEAIEGALAAAYKKEYMTRIKGMKCTVKNKNKVKSVCASKGINSQDCRRMKARLRRGCS